jgi:flagellar biosynthesis protein FliQ
VTVTLLVASLKLALLCAVPLLVAVLLTGLGVSALQAVVGVQDQASAQAARLSVGAITLIAASPWIFRNLMGFTQMLWGDLRRFLH